METPTQIDKPHRMQFAGKMVGAVNPADLSSPIERLAVSGIDRDLIEIFTSESADVLWDSMDRDGLRGFVDRFLLSLGDELEELERAIQELLDGQVIVVIPVHGEEGKKRVSAILEEFDGRSIQYFGRWTATQIGGDRQSISSAARFGDPQTPA